MNGTAPDPIHLPGRVVVFDYGEVISEEPSASNRSDLLAIAGIDDAETDAFWAAYWDGRSELDRFGITIPDYWREVGRRLGHDWPAERVHQLWLTDFVGWLSINPETMRVIEDLAAGGTRLALLSNAGPDYSSFFRNGSFGSLFEQVFVSGEVQLVKPNAEIYEHVLEQLGITAQEMVFIDNKAENIEGAQALGITGHVFTSAAELRSFLVSLAG